MNNQRGYQYRLDTINRLSETLYEIKAAPMSSDQIILFEAGQYCSLSHSGYKSRFFSFADQPVQSGVVTLYVRFAEKDRDYLEDLKRADCIELQGPYGTNHHVWDRRSGRVLLLAEGVGVAPFRGMLKNIKLKNHLIDLLWLIKNEDEVVYFKDMAENLKHLSSKNRLMKVSNTTYYGANLLSGCGVNLDQYDSVCLSGSLKFNEIFVGYLERAHGGANIYSDYLDLNLVKRNSGS